MATNYYTNTSEDSIDGNELQLYTLIMQYRASLGLPSIPLSSGLTITAGRHVLDQIYNTGSYNAHAWSDAAYDSANAATYPNMWKAPQRVSSGYMGDGYEIAAGYLGSGALTATMAPQTALDLWKNSPGHNAVLTNQGPWAGAWNAIGIAIHKGVADVWFGNASDPTGAPVVDTAVADTGSSASGPPVAIPATVPSGTPVDVFRFFDIHDGGHFFTTSPVERAAVLATRPDLRSEGVGFEAFADAKIAGTTAVFRFFDTHDGGHFFTASPVERDVVLATRPDLRFEGIGYYEFAAPQGAKSDAVYRFFDTHDGGHFFTSNTAERDAVLATRPDLAFEGIAFYAPHDGATFVV